MKIYLIKLKLSYSTKYAEFRVDDENPWAGSLLFMNRNEHKGELPIPYIARNKCAPSDFPYSYNFLVSEKFLKVIKSLNHDFEALESLVYYRGKNLKAYCEQSGNQDGRIWDMFYTMVFPEFEFFNWEKSIFVEKISKVTGKRIVTDLQKLVLDSNQLNNHINDLQNNNFFVLKEQLSSRLCTETAKQAIEEAGLTGIDFEEVPVE